MKLICAHVENFGKLHNLDMDFADGLSVIREDNGWGKSTLAAFLRAMFYGLTGHRKKSLAENEYQKYKPWQGGAFGGSITFEVNGTEYVATRMFRSKPNSDVFELRHRDSNLVCTDYSDHLGEELFGINRESFLRTVFLGQNACQTGTTDDINVMLGNAGADAGTGADADASATAADEPVSRAAKLALADLNKYETAINTLTRRMNELNPNRATGSVSKRAETIAQLKADIADGERALESSKGTFQERTQVQERITVLTEQRDEVLEKQETVSRLEQQLLKREVREQLESDRHTRAVELAEMTDFFPQRIPSLKATEEQQTFLARMKRAEMEMSLYTLDDADWKYYQSLKKQFETGAPKEARLEKTLENTNRLMKIRKEGVDPAVNTATGAGKMALIGAALVALGIFMILVLFLETGGFLVSCAGAVCLIAALILWFRGVKLPTEDENAVVADKLSKGIADFLEQYGYKREAEEDYLPALYELKSQADKYNELRRKTIKYNDCEQAINSCKENVAYFLDECGFAPEDDLKAQMNRIEEKVREYHQAGNLLKEAEFKLDRFDKENDLQKAEAELDNLPNLSTLAEKLRTLTEDLEAARAECNTLDAQLEEADAINAQLEPKRAELSSLLEVQAAEEELYAFMDRAKIGLTEAKESITAQYAGPLQESFAKYYEMLVGASADAFRLDANADLTVEEQGMQRNTDTLSVGYQDLANFCLRIALVDAMFQNEQPALILDDPFVNLDDDKTAAGMALLEKISDKYQIVYFTCSEAREKILRT